MLVSQFSGIHSSLERIIIVCMCVHMCKQVCVSFCVHMCVFELTSRLIIKILSMKPDPGILEAVLQTKMHQKCFIDSCMIG